MSRHCADCAGSDQACAMNKPMVWCCIDDGGRPSTGAVQAEPVNRLKLLGLKVLVVSVKEKAEQ
ncbi:MAG: hypothetical protein MRJ65_16135 [Candidatus Brocadiaceae bacterium]|nr:hypothetical protein [Candidatus Brocadiaceae bacterium]